jgi:hypothetical protein
VSDKNPEQQTNESLDEKVAKKNSIPARIVFWLVAIGLLYMFYKAFSGHPSH